MNTPQSDNGSGGPVPLCPPTAIFHCLLERDETTWAGECEAVLGYPVEQMPRTTADRLALVHPDDRQRVATHLDECLGGRVLVRVQYRARGADGGSRRVVEEAASPVPGVVLGALRLGQADIAPQRFFDLSPDLFCIAALDGSVLHANANFSRLFSLLDGAAGGGVFLDYIHPDDQEGAREALSRLERDQAVVSFRARCRDGRGLEHWLEWTIHAYPEEGHLFALGRDVGAGLALERELRAREVREVAILNNTTAVVYVKDPQGRYQFVNDRFAALFRVDRLGVVGKTDQDIFPAEAAAEFQKNDRQVLETRQTLTLQEIAPHDDGPHTYVSVKFPLLDGSGQVAAVAGISTDITDQLRAHDTDEQLRFARLFQQKLYPARAPETPGLDIAGGALPVAQVCGDYYDFIRRDADRLVVAVGDVSGHGYGPALQMVEVRAILRMLLHGSASLGVAAEELNRLLCADLPPGSFLSLFLAELDAEYRLRYIGAGHQALLLRTAGAMEILESTGFLMGLDDATPFEPAAPIELAAGDVLLVFTDGLTEVYNAADEQFGTARVAEVARSHRHEDAEGILRALFTAVFAFSDGRTIQDDMTAVAVRVAG